MDLKEFNENKNVRAGLVSAQLLFSGVILAIPTIALLGEKAIPAAAAGAGFCIVGRVLDKISTQRMISIVDEAEKIGFDHGLSETCPLLSPQPIVNELYGPRKTLAEAALMAASTAVPPFGFIVGISSSLVALHNELLNRETRIDMKFWKRRHNI